MLSGGTPLDKYNLRGIAHAHTNRKDNIFMQRRLYIDEAHMSLPYTAVAVIFMGHPVPIVLIFFWHLSFAGRRGHGKMMQVPGWLNAGPDVMMQVLGCSDKVRGRCYAGPQMV